MWILASFTGLGEQLIYHAGNLLLADQSHPFLVDLSIFVEQDDRRNGTDAELLGAVACFVCIDLADLM